MSSSFLFNFSRQIVLVLTNIYLTHHHLSQDLGQPPQVKSFYFCLLHNTRFKPWHPRNLLVSCEFDKLWESKPNCQVLGQDAQAWLLRPPLLERASYRCSSHYRQQTLYDIHQGWCVVPTSAEPRQKRNASSPILFITSKVPSFSSPQHKQRALQQYQLYMQEANKGIYFMTNSLTERYWMEEISMKKGQQNSPVQQLKSNLMGLELGKLLD